MRNLSEFTITDAVLQRLTDAKTQRVRQISEALVRHLHAFVRDIEPTQSEWETAIDFLTRTGQMCNDKRQEFILLSDTLGVSMLVDAINHRTPQAATETTVLGPFFVKDAPEHACGADISGGVGGDPMLVTGSVVDARNAACRRGRRCLALGRRWLLRRPASGYARDARQIPH
jgi:hydroxyquinol 1,2-dioxygenase